MCEHGCDKTNDSPFTSLNAQGVRARLPSHCDMGQGDGVCPGMHDCASEQGVCCVMCFAGLPPADVQSRGHLCKSDPTGFVCLHYLDKYFSAFELGRPGLLSYFSLPSTEDKTQFVVLRGSLCI